MTYTGPVSNRSWKAGDRVTWSRLRVNTKIVGKIDYVDEVNQVAYCYSDTAKFHPGNMRRRYPVKFERLSLLEGTA